jgi:hypothetical protein
MVPSRLAKRDRSTSSAFARKRSKIVAGGAPPPIVGAGPVEAGGEAAAEGPEEGAEDEDEAKPLSRAADPLRPL